MTYYYCSIECARGQLKRGSNLTMIVVINRCFLDIIIIHYFMRYCREVPGTIRWINSVSEIEETKLSRTCQTLRKINHKPLWSMVWSSKIKCALGRIKIMPTQYRFNGNHRLPECWINTNVLEPVSANGINRPAYQIGIPEKIS